MIGPCAQPAPPAPPASPARADERADLRGDALVAEQLPHRSVGLLGSDLGGVVLEDLALRLDRLGERRWPLGPTRIGSGSAAAWSRAAVFTASPVSIRSRGPEARSTSTSTSPASTPIRMASVGLPSAAKPRLS